MSTPAETFLADVERRLGKVKALEPGFSVGQSDVEILLAMVKASRPYMRRDEKALMDDAVTRTVERLDAEEMDRYRS